MATVEDIESAVTRLSAVDYSRFRDWLLAYDRRIWDQQMTDHAVSGRFDDLAAEALADFRVGRCTNL